MGCASAKYASDPPPAAKPAHKPIVSQPKPPATAADVPKHPQVTLVNQGEQSYYRLAQSFAIVRHGDRLDNEPEWDKYPLRDAYPNDTPLTALGHKHATETGKRLKESGKHWDLIVASPYLRCAQTASRIAEVLGLSVHFDLDLGEIFDDVSMVGGKALKGKPQYRAPKVLYEELRKDFPTVGYVTDASGSLLIEGKLQKFPEDFDAARMRFCYRTKKLLQRGASELMSIVIVTHGDAVGAVLGMLREDWAIKAVPFTSWAIASRDVKVLDKGASEISRHEPVYEDEVKWDIQVCKEIKYESRKNLEKCHQQHERDVRLMGFVGAGMKSSYDLAGVNVFRDALEDMDAEEEDMAFMLQKAQSSAHLSDNTNRMQCKKSAESLENKM
eukprot:TRINITY_DN54634_c0_g1_i1.p1 TRINITY_DN54634_c0_g1~~TRINITY_DN54634_c0_g1_i1.p1  ORF type:complete len:386 (-),score=55.33 TRINITY_DN54634_c0_g1_i1:139-1296(-)